ncbi:MAG: M48 family metallopeptidase [Gaiellaceae bacterium]
MLAPLVHDRPPRPLQLGGQRIAVSVRESRRARRLRIVIGPRQPLEVVVPAGTSNAAIDRLLCDRRGWIEEKLALVELRRSRQLGLAGALWLAGQRLPLEWGRGVRAVASLADGCLSVSGSPAERAAAVERWYRREARERLTEACQREARRLGLEYGAVAVRDQSTRWGSCSSRGTLSFSWRLVIAPAPVLEYVVVHELCHLRHPNHSKAFWRLLEEARPQWRAQAGWLREHGDELLAYEPRAVVCSAPRPAAERRRLFLA